MITIGVQGLDQMQAQLRRFSEQGLREAMAKGLNRTIEAIEQHELVEMERRLDRPTPFTMNALRVFKAKPREGKLDAVLFVQPAQAKYLRTTIHGGTLPVNLTPVLKNQTLNQHGNIRGKRKGLAGIKGNANTKFIGTINNVFGLWQRYGRGGSKLKLLVRVERDAKREARWDFYGIGQRVANERLQSDVASAINDEMRRWR
jgi:hypothetical protein